MTYKIIIRGHFNNDEEAKSTARLLVDGDRDLKVTRIDRVEDTQQVTLLKG